MNSNLLPGVARSDDQEPVHKARETTTRKTRSWRRRIALSAIGVALALVLRRRQGGTSTEREPEESTDGAGGRSVGRRLAAMAVTAVAVAVAGRFVRRATGQRR